MTELNDTNPKKSKEKRNFSFRYEGLYFLKGLFSGLILITILLFTTHKFDYKLKQLSYCCYTNLTEIQKQAEKGLLDFIEGTWKSATGDVYAKININTTKDIIVIEDIGHTRSQKEFKIKEIGTVDGFFGIVNITLCDLNNDCGEPIKIQINKIFGEEDTISIAYNSDFSTCKDQENRCIRGFKKD